MRFVALIDKPSSHHRVGDWRIFFRVEPADLTLYVTAIERRTSTTY